MSRFYLLARSVPYVSMYRRIRDDAQKVFESVSEADQEFLLGEGEVVDVRLRDVTPFAGTIFHVHVELLLSVEEGSLPLLGNGVILFDPVDAPLAGMRLLSTGLCPVEPVDDMVVRYPAVVQVIERHGSASRTVENPFHFVTLKTTLR